MNKVSCTADDFFKLNKNEKLAVTESTIINDLIDEYLERWARPNKRSWIQDEYYLHSNVRPYWGNLLVSEITRRDVVLLLDKIMERGAPIVANRTFSYIRRMFNFAVERGIVDTSPCTNLKSPAKEKSRDRFLTENEIKVIWQAMDQKNNKCISYHEIHMSEPTTLILKLLITLAQRKGEIVKAEWSEIDMHSGWWVIPSFKSKNGKSHRVSLPELAIELLKRAKQLSGASRFVFPSKFGDKPVRTDAIDHAVKRSTFIGVGHWTPHDLRRSAASYMTSMGITRLIVSKILNHTDPSVTSIYDRYSYDKEKKEALDLWAKRLKEFVYNPN